MLSSSNRLAATTQDENAVSTSTRKPAATPHHRRGLVAKTPHGASTNSTRRAFGDISNKKGGGGLASTKQQQPALKKSSSSTIARKKTTNNTVGTKQQQRPSTLKPQRRVEFILPTKEEETVQVEAPELVPEVELPAGRLWSQQADWDDLHDDYGDDDVSLEGASTMREDALRFVEERHKMKLQLEDEHDEFCVRFVEESARQFMDSQELEPPTDVSIDLTDLTADLYALDLSEELTTLPEIGF